MSYKPMVQTDSTGKWYGNALAFRTELEALDNARDLMARWFAVRDCCAMPSDEPANYQYVKGQLIPLARGIDASPLARARCNHE